jgi:periplasmic copper chaperone A
MNPLATTRRTSPSGSEQENHMTPPARRTPARLALAVVALLLAGSLVACGDDDAATTTTSPAGDTTTTEAGAEDGAPTIENQWVRPVTDLDAMDRTAVYMDITGGSSDDALLSASVDPEVAASVEVHETLSGPGEPGTGDEGAGSGMDGSGMDGQQMDGQGMDEAPVGGTETTMPGGTGMMTMQEVERIDIPAGATVRLEPGGFHIMLLDVQQTLEPGDTVEVTLVFESAGEVVVTAEVREP